jgi:hypothetical protein
MQKLLIKMSRRRSLMVPVVTLLAIGIGISGYYIQNRQIVAREQEQQAQKGKEQVATKPTDISTKETVEESTKVTENGEAATVVDVTLVVQNMPANSEVVLSATVASKEPGTCAFYLKQNNYGPEETITIKDGKCEARLQNPGIGTWEGKVLFTSTDGKTRGDAVQTVEL